MQNVLFNIENTLGFAVHKSSYLIKQCVKRVIEKEGIRATAEDFMLMALLDEVGVPQAILLQKTGKDKTTLARQIDRLAQKNWVIRVQTHDDRRSQEILLTSRGAVIKEKMIDSVKKCIAEAIAGIDPVAIEDARKVLIKVANNLRN